MELDTTRFELRRNGVPVALEPQAFDVLAYLASHRDRLVGKDELLDAVWGGRFVTESALTSRIKQVRRAVGDDGRAQEVIRTVHGRGYRFVPPVTVVDAVPVSSEAEGIPAPTPSSGATARIAYTVSDGLHIAYQVTGDGPRDIVLISGFVSHLELDWADPRHAHFLDRLGSMGRLIRFDKRGTGMSDRPPGVPDLETRMHDVLAVMDAVGSRRAVLCGYSEGGPRSVLMAATHPERVSGLALFGSYAKRTRADDNPWAQSIEENAAYAEKLLASWDWEADCRRRCPSADAAMQRWWAQRMRAAATPGTVRALMQMNARVDVRDALPAVRVPTLVLHRRGDPLFRVDEARYLAEHIPGARLHAEVPAPRATSSVVVSGAPIGRAHSVQRVPTPAVLRLGPGMVELAVGMHADALHDGARPGIRHHREGHDLRQADEVEPVRDRGSRRLGGDALAPPLRVQPPAHFHDRLVVRERYLERRLHQAGEPGERRGAALAVEHLDHPQGVAQAPMLFLEPIHERVRGSPVHQPREVAHDLRVTVHRRTGCPVAFTPLPQQQTGRAQDGSWLGVIGGHRRPPEPRATSSRRSPTASTSSPHWRNQQSTRTYCREHHARCPATPSGPVGASTV